MSPPNPFDAIFNAFNRSSITLLHSLKFFITLAIPIINSVKDKIIYFCDGYDQTKILYNLKN